MDLRIPPLKIKITTIDGILTTGNTTINGDLTINVVYTGDDSYTNSEIDYA